MAKSRRRRARRGPHEPSGACWPPTTDVRGGAWSARAVGSRLVWNANRPADSTPRVSSWRAGPFRGFSRSGARGRPASRRERHTSLTGCSAKGSSYTRRRGTDGHGRSASVVLHSGERRAVSASVAESSGHWRTPTTPKGSALRTSIAVGAEPQTGQLVACSLYRSR